MERHARVVLAMLGIVVSLAGAGTAFAEQAAPKVDPKADEVMRRWGEAAGRLTNVRVRVEDTIDHVLGTGQKVQFCHVRTATIGRPNKLRMEVVGDLANVSIWKDEKTFTILDRDENEYWQVAAPGTIDETMDMLQERYGITTPLADLLTADVHKTLLQQVEAGAYLGLHRVGEAKCHHVLFTQDDIDWQAWVEEAERPIIRKMVITYKNEPGQPQYTLRNLGVETPDQLPAKTFQFEAPAGAKKTEVPPKGRVRPSKTDESR